MRSFNECAFIVRELLCKTFQHVFGIETLSHNSLNKGIVSSDHQTPFHVLREILIFPLMSDPFICRFSKEFKGKYQSLLFFFVTSERFVSNGSLMVGTL